MNPADDSVGRHRVRLRTIDGRQPAPLSNLNWLAKDKPVLFLLVLLSYIIIELKR